ncbi:MAG: hypothetical protein ABJP45_01525 [Cyclobacteriaceae bacterium]
MSNFHPTTIVIRSIFKKSLFVEFEDLGYSIKYHDDSGPKDHFEESEWIIAAVIYFATDVIRDFLKDKAKGGLDNFVTATARICRKAFSKKVYKLSGRTKKLKKQQIEIGIQGYDKQLIINRDDEYLEKLLNYINEYESWLESQNT